jgi:hypothetical protein
MKIVGVNNLFKSLIALAVLAGAQAWAVPFTPGNLAIVVAPTATTTSNTTANIVELNTTTANQPGVQTISVDGTGPNAIRISGSATSTGYASHSNDRSLFTFTGVNLDGNTTTNVNALNPRAVVTLNAAGTVSIATTYTGNTSGNQTRSATTLDNSTWFIGDQAGFYTNGASTPSPTGNFRSVKSFGGSVYVFTASASAASVSTINLPTGGTLTALPGLANGATTNQDFYMTASGANGTTYDTLYILSTTNATTGTIAKFSFIDTNADLTLDSWTANGTYATTFGGFGLAAAKDGVGSDLYVTTGTGASANNSVIKLLDTAGYNAAININTPDNVTLYTTSGGANIKGIDFAPVAVPEPSTFALAGIGLLGVVRFVRRKRSV